MKYGVLLSSENDENILLETESLKDAFERYDDECFYIKRDKRESEECNVIILDDYKDEKSEECDIIIFDDYEDGNFGYLNDDFQKWAEHWAKIACDPTDHYRYYWKYPYEELKAGGEALPEGVDGEDLSYFWSRYVEILSTYCAENDDFDEWKAYCKF